MARATKGPLDLLGAWRPLGWYAISGLGRRRVYPRCIVCDGRFPTPRDDPWFCSRACADQYHAECESGVRGGED